MRDRPNVVRWKAALISGSVCGVIGPGMPVLAQAPLVLAHASSFRDLSQLAAIPLIWVFAIVFVGPAGFLLGAAYGVVLQAITEKFRLNRWVILVAAVLGLGFGSAVPLVSNVIGLRITYDTLGEMGTAAPTGMVCGLLVLWLFQRGRVLRLRNEG